MTQRLLVRNLDQLATPAGTDAPLRGSSLGEVEMLEHAFVLCDGDTIEAVGRMANLPVLDDDVEVDRDAAVTVAADLDVAHSSP